MSDKTFTLDEAQSMLPALAGLVRTAIDGKKIMDEVDTEFQALAHRVFLAGGLLVNVAHYARRRAERDKALQRVKDAVHEIDAIGVQIKDLDIGLLDFPCLVNGETVLLCWKLGEKKITQLRTVQPKTAPTKSTNWQARVARTLRSARSCSSKTNNSPPASTHVAAGALA